MITFANNNKFYAKYYNDTTDNEVIRMVVNNFQDRVNEHTNEPILYPIATSSLFHRMQKDPL